MADVGHVDGVDGSRLLANYLVVLLHAATALQFVSRNMVEASFWRMVCGSLCTLALPMLFFISGYFMSVGYERHGYSGLIRRRFRRLAVPYLVWNVIFILIYIGASFFGALYANRVEKLGLLSLDGWLNVVNPLAQSIDGPLWYVRSVFILAVFFPLADSLLRISKGFFALFILIAWCVFSHFRDLEVVLQLSFPAYALVTFFLGAWMHVHRVDIFKIVNRWSVSLGLVLVLIRYFSRLSESPTYWLLRNITWTFSFVVILYLGRKVEGWSHRCSAANKVYNMLRECSFFVYASHIIICPILSHTLARVVPLNSVGAPTVLVLGYFILGSALCIGLYYLIGARFASIRRILNAEV